MPNPNKPHISWKIISACKNLNFKKLTLIQNHKYCVILLNIFILPKTKQPLFLQNLVSDQFARKTSTKKDNRRWWNHWEIVSYTSTLWLQSEWSRCKRKALKMPQLFIPAIFDDCTVSQYSLKKPCQMDSFIKYQQKEYVLFIIPK